MIGKERAGSEHSPFRFEQEEPEVKDRPSGGEPLQGTGARTGPQVRAPTWDGQQTSLPWVSPWGCGGWDP